MSESCRILSNDALGCGWGVGKTEANEHCQVVYQFIDLRQVVTLQSSAESTVEFITCPLYRSSFHLLHFSPVFQGTGETQSANGIMQGLPQDHNLKWHSLSKAKDEPQWDLMGFPRCPWIHFNILTDIADLQNPSEILIKCSDLPILEVAKASVLDLYTYKGITSGSMIRSALVAMKKRIQTNAEAATMATILHSCHPSSPEINFLEEITPRRKRNLRRTARCCSGPRKCWKCHWHEKRTVGILPHTLHSCPKGNSTCCCDAHSSWFKQMPYIFPILFRLCAKIQLFKNWNSYSYCPSWSCKLPDVKIASSNPTETSKFVRVT